MKGIIALDIDGTVTVESCPINGEVVAFLHQLHRMGWQLLFITGRSLNWCTALLKLLPFDYYLALHNGSIAFYMPRKTMIFKKLLDRTILPAIEKISHDEETHFAIYGGSDAGDQCYYCPDKLPSQLREYLKKRSASQGEAWRAMVDFDQMPLDEFAAIKWFSTEKKALRIASKVQRQLSLNAPIIVDPYCCDYYIVQATHAALDKGKALLELRAKVDPGAVTIAAGNDLNDLSMLLEADIAIAMAKSPQPLIDIADIVAPPVIENGIITGLKQALALL